MNNPEETSKALKEQLLFSYEDKEKQKSTLQSDKRILLSSHIASDGVGDFYHLRDLAQHTELLPDYIKDVLMTTTHKPEIIERFKRKLEGVGFKTIVIKKPFDISSMVKSNEKVALILDELPRNVQGIILELNKIYAGNISISFDVFKGVKRDLFTMPRLLFDEHHGASSGDQSTIVNGTPRTKIPMNFISGTKSIFLCNEDRDNPAMQLAIVLLKEVNSKAKIALLGEKISSDTNELSELCEIFLKQNLFVPCYFQHNDAAVVNFINVALESPLSKKYQAAVFFVNELNVKIIEKAMNLGFVSRKIKEVIIKEEGGGKETVKKIINPNSDFDAKTVTLISGYRIEDDNDYNKLFHCAQYFAGCSGDKTLEMVLSNGLIPFFIPNLGDHGKEDFLNDAVTFNKLFYPVQRLYYLNQILMRVVYGYHVLPNLINVLTNTLQISETEFPKIVQNWIKLVNEGESFKHLGITYALEYDDNQKKEIAKIYLRKLNEYKKINTKEEYNDLRSRFMAATIDKDPDILKSFIESLEIQGNAELVSLTNNIADKLKTGSPIRLDERQFKGNFSRENERKLLLIAEQEVIPLVQKHIEDNLSKIASGCDDVFFKEWTELCDNLKKEYNLHLKLPEIVDHFLGKYLKEAPRNNMP